MRLEDATLLARLEDAALLALDGAALLALDGATLLALDGATLLAPTPPFAKLVAVIQPTLGKACNCS